MRMAARSVTIYDWTSAHFYVVIPATTLHRVQCAIGLICAIRMPIAHIRITWHALGIAIVTWPVCCCHLGQRNYRQDTQNGGHTEHPRLSHLASLITPES